MIDIWRDTMDINDPSFQRRAIFQGLAPYLKRGDLFQALWQWQEKYSHTENPSVNVFVQELCEQHRIHEQRGAIYQSVQHALQKDIDELGPDPLSEMMQQRVKDNSLQTTNNENIPVSTSVFCRTLTEFFDAIAFESHDLANRCKQYLSRNLHQVVTQKESDALVSWLLYPKMTLKKELSLESMRGMLHICYVGACEYLGPVKADQYLADAVKKAEMMGEAMYFSPRQLL